jgi:cell division protein FtsL
MGPKNKKEGSYWTIRAFSLLAVVFLGFVTYSVFKVVYRKKQVQKEISSLQEEAIKIEKENGDLKDKISYFESKDYQEREVKDKLSLQLPDENLVVVKPGPAKKEEASPVETAKMNREIDKTPIYQKWLNYFFKY